MSEVTTRCTKLVRTSWAKDMLNLGQDPMSKVPQTIKGSHRLCRPGVTSVFSWSYPNTVITLVVTYLLTWRDPSSKVVPNPKILNPEPLHPDL